MIVGKQNFFSLSGWAVASSRANEAIHTVGTSTIVTQGRQGTAAMINEQANEQNRRHHVRREKLLSFQDNGLRTGGLFGPIHDVRLLPGRQGLQPARPGARQTDSQQF